MSFSACVLFAALSAPALGSPCPTIATAERPVCVYTNDAGRITVDFGRDAFGWLELVAPRTGDYFVVLGEKLGADGGVERGFASNVRAVEFFDAPFEVTADTVRRQVVSVSADRGESAFFCDSSALVRVYDFCKHTMFATSFAGLFVDGDRERIPYEADGYVSQLNWLSVSSDNSYPRGHLARTDADGESGKF